MTDMARAIQRELDQMRADMRWAIEVRELLFPPPTALEIAPQVGGAVAAGALALATLFAYLR